jgi:hypothetical protein
VVEPTVRREDVRSRRLRLPRPQRPLRISQTQCVALALTKLFLGPADVLLERVWPLTLVESRSSRSNGRFGSLSAEHAQREDAEHGLVRSPPHATKLTECGGTRAGPEETAYFIISNARVHDSERGCMQELSASSGQSEERRGFHNVAWLVWSSGRRYQVLNCAYHRRPCKSRARAFIARLLVVPLKML